MFALSTSSFVREQFITPPPQSSALRNIFFIELVQQVDDYVGIQNHFRISHIEVVLKVN